MWVLQIWQYKCLHDDLLFIFFSKSSTHMSNSVFEIVMWKWQSLNGSESFFQIVTNPAIEALFSTWHFFHVGGNNF